MAQPTPRPPADSAPWDPANGLRVGLLAGAGLGALAMILTGVTNVVMVVAPALVGGAVGWWWQRRRRRGAS